MMLKSTLFGEGGRRGKELLVEFAPVLSSPFPTVPVAAGTSAAGGGVLMFEATPWRVLVFEGIGVRGRWMGWFVVGFFFQRVVGQSSGFLSV